MVENSVVLPAFFPRSIDSEKDFIKAIELLKEYNIDVIEFYYKNNNREIIKNILNKYNLRSIYLAAMKAKQENLNLSSLDREIRKKSIKEIKKCIDDAYFYNSESILINSGKRQLPVLENNIYFGYEYLKESLVSLLEYIDTKSKDYKLNLTLEPGDTEIDSFSLIGHTDIAIKLIKELREEYENVSLTMDTSHIIQLGEDPITSINKSFSYCSHIHLANCIIKDKLHELYGDKHPEFGLPDSELSLDDTKLMFNQIKRIYKNNILIIGLEIIFRNDQLQDMNQFDYFINTMKKLFFLGVGRNNE